jgi:hypothetical protein
MMLVWQKVIVLDDFIETGEKDLAKKSTQTHLSVNPASLRKRASKPHVRVSMRGFQPSKSQAERLPLARVVNF